jgi:hypothetical protein
MLFCTVMGAAFRLLGLRSLRCGALGTIVALMWLKLRTIRREPRIDATEICSSYLPRSVRRSGARRANLRMHNARCGGRPRAAHLCAIIMENPNDPVCSVLRLADKFHQTTIVFDLFGNNQLAAYKVSNCRMIGRAMLQSVFYLFFESRVSPFQVRNGCLLHAIRHDLFPKRSELQRRPGSKDAIGWGYSQLDQRTLSLSTLSQWPRRDGASDLCEPRRCSPERLDQRLRRERCLLLADSVAKVPKRRAALIPTLQALSSQRDDVTPWAAADNFRG